MDARPSRRMPSSRMPAASAPILLALLLAVPTAARAAPMRDVPIDVKAPGGRVLHLFASGDERGRRVYDADGYTVVRDPATSRVVYATLRQGRLVPTDLEVGRGDPRTLRLVPGLDAAPEPRATAMPARATLPGPQYSAPTAGELHNLVVFVRFADEAPLATPTAKLQQMLNSLEPGVPSVRGYYREASYGQLDVISDLLPAQTGDVILTWQDENPRSFYQPYDAATNPGGYPDGGTSMIREQTMARRAMDAVAADIPPFLDLDGDDDGFVDNMTIVASGKPGGWMDLLWPHQSLILADQIFIGDLQVLTYNLQLMDTLVDRTRVGVLAHELFHTLGAPDLYHYSYDKKTPAGPWDLMERDLDTPQHMSLHMKERYGKWVPPVPEITESGTYVVNPLTSPEGQGWRLPIPGQPRQYFVVEYRRATGTYESSLPRSGLLVWRVDDRWWGNNDGPPDEVYVFRPGGTPQADGDIQEAGFSENAARTAFTPATDPSPFDQLGAPVGLRITEVSRAGGETMSFTVCLAYSTCFLKECGDDGCGGTCGACGEDRVCEDRMCVAQQKCATLAACLGTCGDAACRDACRQAPAACPAVACRVGTCDESTGECGYVDSPPDTPCDDGDACTLDDRCGTGGTCAGSPDPACPVADAAPEGAGDTGPADVPVEDSREPAEATTVPDAGSVDVTGADRGPADLAIEAVPELPSADATGDDASRRAATGGGCSGRATASPLPVALWLALAFLAGVRRRVRREPPERTLDGAGPRW